MAKNTKYHLKHKKYSALGAPGYNPSWIPENMSKSRKYGQKFDKTATRTQEIDQKSQKN